MGEVDTKRLSPGFKVKTNTGIDAEVIEFLGAGGQGEVYKVKYCGEDKALKWYTCLFNNEKAFYNNLSDNAKNGSPAPNFVWPIAVTKKQKDNSGHESFGYIMDLIPEGYYEVNDFRLALVHFKSFKELVEACIQIVSAFRILHGSGYAYQDINGGNFLIDPNTGNVKICDNDNIAPNTTSTGIGGTPGYIAPEVLLGNSKPERRTDYFSLAVLLFILICANHPLEGKRWVSYTVIDDVRGQELYAKNPVFICDPKDTSNGPVKQYHKDLIARWSCLPDYMKDIFYKAFSKEAFTNPNRRPIDLDWLEALCRFRSEIVQCSCGAGIFINEGKTTKCDVCSKPYTVKYSVKLPDYNLAIVNGGRLYRCQLGICKTEEALEPIGVFLQKNPNTFGFRNKTNKILSITKPDGGTDKLDPNGIVVIEKGLKIKVDNVQLIIE